ncbi:hypothetical protein BDP27DRAFT_1241851 [Rhodocollybia butyracea]|uniref:Sodium/calcium exchanger membrane region domain-containing protein n=1 Tax=Rhodocollybia butyracea TaxID=206335 RepID=A0A9P5TWB9_9AGAR|nr:hypothetical protein BDP27DRAFT_1241851 [Rhodocollybia butyracea]
MADLEPTTATLSTNFKNESTSTYELENFAKFTNANNIESGLPLLPQFSRNPESDSTSNATKHPASARLKARFVGRGKQIGVVESLKAIVCSSWLNLLVVFIPLSWIVHFLNHQNVDDLHLHLMPFSLTFSFSLLALIPLERLVEYGGEQMSLYCGKDLGDLIVITLNNTVEASLAIILFIRCELRLLQSTIIGVVILHLLLVPGVTFIAGGTKRVYQELNPHVAQLNHTLLIMGVLTMILPLALYNTLHETSLQGDNAPSLQGSILKISRGIAIISNLVYVFSRIFLHDPPGNNNAFTSFPDAPAAVIEEEEELLEEVPEVNPWVCIALLVVTIGLIAPTTEYLVDSVDVVREKGNIPEEWFGLILLPLASFSADGLLAIGHFLRSFVLSYKGQPIPVLVLAKARSIDMSIQFNLFWIPVLVLVGWFDDRPMSLLFDRFEAILLIGACFLVNYVTADAKTNWAEGATMVSFYVMIALTAWFYISDPGIAALLIGGKCPPPLTPE